MTKKKRRSVKFKGQSIFRSMRGAILIEMLRLMALAQCILIGIFFITIIIEDSRCGWLLGVLAFFIFLMALAVLKDLWSGSGLPKCRNGCCHGNGYFSGHGDYNIQGFGEEFYKVCHCGGRYQQ